MSKKMAKAIDARNLSPFMAAVRNFLLHVRRRERMNPDDWLTPNRFVDTQSARTQPPPTIPGGVHHKIAANCYFERDFRRTVPPPLTVADSQLLLSDKLASRVDTEKNVKPQSFSAPTPGFGIEMKRNKTKELPSMPLVPD